MIWSILRSLLYTGFIKQTIKAELNLNIPVEVILRKLQKNPLTVLLNTSNKAVSNWANIMLILLLVKFY